MVRIRLRRIGLKGQASYRIVVADKESPRDGRFLEIVGSYNPRTEPFTFHVKEERVYHWMKNGAQPTESVQQLFDSVGLSKRYARVKAGEAMETVLKEAEAYYTARKVDVKTNPA
ncbi:MAG: 30S ribosomal protein S16 [Bellilinea sp.]|jgi:small subunit ribosomal protein S16